MLNCIMVKVTNYFIKGSMFTPSCKGLDSPPLFFLFKFVQGCLIQNLNV